MSEEARFARVAVPLPVDTLFTYAIPAGMDVEPGHAVRVPFGAQQLTGTVVSCTSTADIDHPKPILGLADPVPVIDAHQLDLCRWAARYYLAGLGEMIATAIPSPFKAKSRRVLEATAAGVAGLAARGDDTSAETLVLREVVARPGRTRSGLAHALTEDLDAAEVEAALAALARAGLVAVRVEEPKEVGIKRTFVHLLPAADAIALSGGARMREVLSALREAGGTQPLDHLVDTLGPGAREAITRMERKGWVRREDCEDQRPADAGPLPPPSVAPPLNDEQTTAVTAILGADPRPWLLHGVTGAGKTEVYLHLAREVLARGRQVLVLVPEIALTPQLLSRFRGRFGDAVAVLHSGLGPGERLREWRRIRAGVARVAVGARSAIFAPFADLGLVIVDEEHDDSYKQDDGVRYHARDLAVLRGHLLKAIVVLGSATPSLESWANAREGRYGLVRLTRRATPRPVPRIELIPMRGRPASLALAPELVEALRETFAGPGKAIVLYNRRGYAPTVECAGCGAFFECPSCRVGMVYHQRTQRVDCHYCGYHVPFRSDCQVCGGEIQLAGHGTERVEEELQAQFPDIGILRMDADTTRGRGAHASLLDRFRDGDARLLVGTQLVAKGHDFPDVHLAAVVGVDHILTMADFRSSERTWGLVSQLAGRAGRGDRPGRVLVQTRHDDHFVFRMLSGNPEDLDTFLEKEAHQRRMLGYPPTTRLTMIRVDGVDRGLAYGKAQEIARLLRAAAQSLPPFHGRLPVDVLGPTPAPMARLVGRYRFQVVVRGRNIDLYRRLLQDHRAALRAPARGGVRVTLDVDPRSLL